MNNNTNYTGAEIAVIGLSCRFPFAKNVREFWDNLKEGKECISFFTREELLEAGLDAETIDSPNYVKARGYLQNKDTFDWKLFGYKPNEAKIMNPQTRILHECIYEALENAGYAPGATKGNVGLYLGASNSAPWESMGVLLNLRGEESGNSKYLRDRDFMSSRIAYNLNLKGPVCLYNTACSTSLVALHHACRGLLTSDCKIAIVGGVGINAYSKRGYQYDDGSIASTDGHCKAFSDEATGTVPGEGAGIVILKRLKDAIENKDNIQAIIRSSYVNNDGNAKIGFTAPSFEGQVKVIKRSQLLANISPESISFVETHGTGTKLGDAIEIQALKEVFGTSNKKTCFLGSVKTNIGHLDAAAGIASVIKTILCLKHKQLPPTLHYNKPNAELDLDNSPFLINTTLKKIENSDHTFKAGVSSFGIGGTNAHIILEEAPIAQIEDYSKEFNILILSAASKPALDIEVVNLKNFLAQNKSVNLTLVANTLQCGRKNLPFKQAIVCNTAENAIEILNKHETGEKNFIQTDNNDKNIVFVFSGMGLVYHKICHELYLNDFLFSTKLNDNCKIIENRTGINIQQYLFSSEKDFLKIFQNGYFIFEQF